MPVAPPPYLQNYQQSTNVPQAQAQPQPQQAANQPYNPFDLGIKRAIAAARESLGLTEKQQEKALRRSLIEFGNHMAQEPVRKGFWNNFGAVSRSVAPAILEYDEVEDEMMDQNNALANQILAYQNAMEARELAQQDRMEALKEREWQHKHAEAQLEEQIRFHDQSAQWHINAKTSEAKEAKEDLLSLLANANELVDKLGEKGFRSRAQLYMDKFTPGGTQLTPEQQRIQTLGEILQGRLFSAWNYKTQAEFGHIPKISPMNPPAVNKSIIKELLEATNKNFEDEPGVNIPNKIVQQQIPQENVINNQQVLPNLNALQNTQLQVPKAPPAVAKSLKTENVIYVVDEAGNLIQIPDTKEDLANALAKGLKPYSLE